MKVVTAREMSRIEKLAYADGASEEQFMQTAAEGVAQAAERLILQLDLKPCILLLCGPGNNGGDAFAAGKILLEKGFEVEALALAPFEKRSRLCQLQSQRFADAGGNIFTFDENEVWSRCSLLLDGLLGTGFHGEVTGLLKQAIEEANASGLPILSIDIPSGMDGTTGAIGGVCIRASETLFLGLPKTGCFSLEAWEWVGKVSVHNFGLGPAYIDAAEADYHLIDDVWMREHLPRIKRTRHKYEAGYVVGVGGSPGMPGAPLMSCFAALRAGAGIVRLLHPAGMEAELAFAPYEIIRQGYKDSTAILSAAERASALFIGPGIGTSPTTLKILQDILPQIKQPSVLDAEALTLLSEHEIRLPANTILTPHHGEMKRLLHAPKELPFNELVSRSHAYAESKKVTLVLKGAPTFIFHPGLRPFVCARGDPGMATAGSGDVLTGIIAGLLAQTKNPLHAALLGVQLHSIAGEHAAANLTSYCMAATDITAALPQAFKEILHCEKVSSLLNCAFLGGIK